MRILKIAFIMLLICAEALIITGALPDKNTSADMKKPSVFNIPVQEKRIKADVAFLTSIKPGRSFANISSLNACADYILRQFQLLQCTVQVQTFQVQDAEYKNIICSFGPADSERVIVGAHYDVFGDMPGADDNASGVAGILELARLINELRPELKYRIDLAAYTLEEPPFFRTEHMGSFIHAKSLSDNSVKVKVMLALEMIGYFTDKPKSQEFPAFFLKWFYPDKGNFITAIGKLGQADVTEKIKKSMTEASNIDVHSFSGPAFFSGVDFSDHLNYWKHGFDAVMITDTSFYRNPHYHSPSDTIDTLDFKKTAEVIRGVYWAILNQ